MPHAPDRPPGLGKNQAWYARKVFVLRSGTYDADALFEAGARSLEDQGFAVTLYDSPSSLRMAVGVRDDVSVQLSIRPLDVTISAGPCGASFTQVRDYFTKVS